MLHPELRYEMAKYEHQARIDAAARRREVRDMHRAQRQERGSWLASIGSRFHRAHAAEVARPAGADVVVASPAATSTVGHAIAI